MAGVGTHVRRGKPVTRARCLAVAQAGGPTAVINASLAGFAVEAHRHGEVFGVLGGPVGLVRGHLVPIDEAGLRSVRASAMRPGAALGAGRLALSAQLLDDAASHLAEHEIDGIAVIGGNGTMRLCEGLLAASKRAGTDLRVVGIPKTVDNDLVGTDHSPGFPSAALCLISLVADLDTDHRSMTSIEPVRIVETLGRSVGWLALATFLARRTEGDGPHLVLLPERSFTEQELLGLVDDAVRIHGRSLVVIAEGAVAELGGSTFEEETFDRPLQSAVGARLGAVIKDKLGIRSRVEVPGLIQRSCSLAVSPVDRQEAWAVGEHGARLLVSGCSGLMVSIASRPGRAPAGAAGATGDGATGDGATGDGATGDGAPGDRDLADLISTVALGEVAGRVRRVPAEWAASATDAPAGLDDWLSPLLGPRLDLVDG
ncbi:MAG: 6-phosphofructokinase [Acidimicrobiales bacterium]